MMLLICINALLRFQRVSGISRLLPTVQTSEEAVTLMSHSPNFSPPLRIRSGWAWGDPGWLINRVLVLNAIHSHDPSGVAHSFVAGKQVMNVHSAGIHVFE